MSRPKKIDRTVDVHIMLPEDLVFAVDTFLYSELQQRVPLGARQRFYTAAAWEYLDKLKGPGNDQEANSGG